MQTTSRFVRCYEFFFQTKPFDGASGDGRILSLYKGTDLKNFQTHFEAMYISRKLLKVNIDDF